MSGDPGQEYFSDGLSDTLIHVLAQVSGLKVTAKTSSFYFKGKNMDVSEIARELNVGTILEGSVQKTGDRVRVIAQLVNAEDGTHLWSKSFDRDLQDLFAVQDEIAQEVVKSLKVTLLETEEEKLAHRYQPVPAAYDRLILGRYEMAKQTAVNLAAAEQHFKHAIELDPDYALAYVGLADTYDLQWRYAYLVLEESLRLRAPLVEKALDLDPLSGEAYVAKASLLHHQQLKSGEGKYAAEEQAMRKALELSPNYAPALHWYSYRLNDQEVLARLRMAAELDPMSPSLQLIVAEATWATGHVDEALRLIRHNIERFPEFPNNYSSMAEIQTRLGHLGEAQRWFQEARRRNPEAYSWWSECLGLLHLGDAHAAEDCARQFSEAHPKKVIPQVVWAALYQFRGEWSAAIESVESLSEQWRGWPAFDRWLANLVAGRGDIERARRLMANAFPELLEDGLDLEVDDWYLAAVIHFAAILHATGETQQRDVLLLALENRIATMHRIHGVGYGILDVYIYAIRGDRDRAIAGLRKAIDMGWRGGNWLEPWLLREDWKLASLHEDSEFVALVDELEADIRKQRERYEEQKEDPLF